MTRASARELKRVGALITSCGLEMIRPLPPVWSSPRHLRPV